MREEEAPVLSVVVAVAVALGLPVGVTGLLLGAAAALAATTAVRAILLLRRPVDEVRKRWRSLATWWLLLTALVVVAVLGRPAVVVAMAAASLLLVRETLSLTGTDRWLPAGVVVVLVVYLWAWLDWRSLFFRAVPAALLAVAAAEALWRTSPRPGLAPLRGFVVAVLVAVVGPAHVVAVASGRPEGLSWPSPVVWLVVLLLLTELNDIAQAWCGRAVGRHAMAPVLSPHKTWEGLVGGLAATVVAAAFLVPLAMGSAGAPEPGGGPAGLSRVWWAGLGLAIALAGTAGDLTASALKRAAGVKDSGDLLPGHGGVLDRFDSLVLSAPVFLALLHLLGRLGP